MDKFVQWLRRKKPGTVVRLRDYWMQYVYRALGVMGVYAALSVKVYRKSGEVEDRGVVATHAVTLAFVEQLVDTLQASVAAFSDYKYHDSGTGVVAEADTDTTLGTPCGEARDVGTQTEGVAAYIYKTVATHTYAGTFTITEHGVFNAAGAGELMDRSMFSGNAVNVESGDKIEFTYELTCVAGG